MGAGTGGVPAGTSGELIRLSIQLEPKSVAQMDRIVQVRKSSRAAIVRELLEPAIKELESKVLQEEFAKQRGAA